MRSLTKDECESLGNWIAEACQSRPHELSARVDGWCGDKMRGVSDGSWVPYDCVANVKLIDEVCFRGTNNVHSMMDCDRQVHRP